MDTEIHAYVIRNEMAAREERIRARRHHPAPTRTTRRTDGLARGRAPWRRRA
jgi:hypothetical protein